MPLKTAIAAVFGVATLAATAFGSAVAQPAPQIIDVPPGQASDLFFFVNTTGKVYVKIAAEGNNRPCSNLWWIKWGVGTVEQLGEKCGSFSLDIPGLSTVSGKLRIAGRDYRMKVAVSSEETVAHSATIKF